MKQTIGAREIMEARQSLRLSTKQGDLTRARANVSRADHQGIGLPVELHVSSA